MLTVGSGEKTQHINQKQNGLWQSVLRDHRTRSKTLKSAGEVEATRELSLGGGEGMELAKQTTGEKGFSGRDCKHGHGRNCDRDRVTQREDAWLSGMRLQGQPGTRQDLAEFLLPLAIVRQRN